MTQAALKSNKSAKTPRPQNPKARAVRKGKANPSPRKTSRVKPPKPQSVPVFDPYRLGDVLSVPADHPLLQRTVWVAVVWADENGEPCDRDDTDRDPSWWHHGLDEQGRPADPLCWLCIPLVFADEHEAAAYGQYHNTTDYDYDPLELPLLEVARVTRSIDDPRHRVRFVWAMIEGRPQKVPLKKIHTLFATTVSQKQRP